MIFPTVGCWGKKGQICLDPENNKRFVKKELWEMTLYAIRIKRLDWISLGKWILLLLTANWCKTKFVFSVKKIKFSWNVDLILVTVISNGKLLFASNHTFDPNVQDGKKLSSQVVTQYDYSWCVALLAFSWLLKAYVQCLCDSRA